MQLSSWVFILATCLERASCVSHTLDPNRQLGVDIGGLIRNVSSEVAADSSHTYPKGLVDALGSDEEVLVNPRVSEVVARANSLASHERIDRDGFCVRDWSQPCPAGWLRLGRFECKAPTSYGGACRQMQSFAHASALDKYRFAVACGAAWPCEGDCAEGRDYDRCPTGWTSSGNGFCQTGAAPDAGCMSIYKFDEMIVSDKEELGRACGLEWACRQTCVQDFSNPCPEGWTVQSGTGVCAAPATYVGSCSYEVNTTGMDEAQKRALAEKCSVEFSCVG